MPCPKCNGRLDWKERSWTTAGEDPGHWSCIMCGKMVYPEKANSQKCEENIPTFVPSIGDGKGEEEMRTDKGKECTRKECKRRGQALPFEEFSKNKANSDGYEYYCKQCKADLAAAKRERIKKEAEGGSDRREKNQPRNPGPVGSEIAAPRSVPPETITLDIQLLRAVKKSAILDFIKNDLPRLVEEAFA